MPPKLHAKLCLETDVEQRVGEIVTLATVRELLKAQENMFKALFELSMNTVNKRIDNLITTVSDLKASLEFTQKDLQELIPSVEKVSIIEQEISNTKSYVNQQKDKAEYLENQSRRNIIRVDGIPEVHGETWDTTESLVKEVLKDKLQMSDEIFIERAHRVGRKVSSQDSNSYTSTRPRTIVSRLNHWKQKESILKNARKLKPRGIFFNEDLAFETLQKRRAQVSQLIEAKRSGRIAYFILDKLIIRDKPVAKYDKCSSVRFLSFPLLKLVFQLINSSKDLIYLAFYGLGDTEIFHVIFEQQLGSIHYDSDHLLSLKFNPLSTDLYFNQCLTLANDLDPDSNFYSNLNSCDYLVKNQFNNILNNKVGNKEHFSLFHLKITSLQANFDGLTNLL